MTIVKLANNIAEKNRNKKANDIVYTPIKLVERHIEHIKDLVEPNDIIYESFSGDGRYVKQLRKKFQNKIVETEIQNGTDFFEFNEPVDILITNPAYSIMDKVLEHSVKLKPRIISYLIGMMNFTPKRIAYMNENGYYIDRIFFCRVRNWFGITSIITFSNQINKNIVEVERFEFNNKYD